MTGRQASRGKPPFTYSCAPGALSICVYSTSPVGSRSKRPTYETVLAAPAGCSSSMVSVVSEKAISKNTPGTLNGPHMGGGGGAGFAQAVELTGLASTRTLPLGSNAAGPSPTANRVPVTGSKTGKSIAAVFAHVPAAML